MPLDTGKQIRLATDNLLRTGYNAITSSSENPTKPLTNLTDLVNMNFRNRVFSFQGRFTIGATNYKLHFNDGANKTATITQREYTFPEDLAFEIATQLNAVSNGFQCSYDSTSDEFKIRRTTGGWTARISVATDAIWTTIGFVGNLDIAVLVNVYLFADEIRCHWPNEFIKVDFGYQADIGFLAMIPPSTDAFGVSDDGEVRVQANTIDDFTAPAIDIVLSTSDFGVFKFFEDADYQYRYWKIIFTDPTNNGGPGFLRIGNLFLGQYQTFYNPTSSKTHYNAQGAAHRLIDPTEVQTSAAGVKYFNRKTKFREYTGINMEMLDPTSKQILYDLVEEKGTHDPWYISVDPKLQISNNLYDFTFFCRLKESPVFRHFRRKHYNVPFDVEEVV